MNAEDPAPRRKLRFAPKARPKKAVLPPSAPITNKEEAAAAQALSRRLSENRRRQKPKVEDSPKQVAFGPGATPSTSARVTSIRQNAGTSESGVPGFHSLKLEEDFHSLVPDVDAPAASSLTKREYKEPWDYSTYYPISLPLRRPYSGDPELLDEAEFGETAGAAEYDESLINPAKELGLLDGSERMIFFQFPSNLPLVQLPAKSTIDSAKGKEKHVAGNSIMAPKKISTSQKECTLKELPKGQLGKLLVYKSGSLRLKIGDVLYDVSPGSECCFPQDFVAIDTEAKHCYNIRNVDTKAVLTPNLDAVGLRQ